MTSVNEPRRSLRSRLGLGTVRSRISGIIILITAISMILVGVGLFVIQIRAAHDRVNGALVHSEDTLRNFATKVPTMSSDARPENTEEFLRLFLERELPAPNEAILTYSDGALYFHQEDQGIPAIDDEELLARISPLTRATSTIWRDIDTEVARYRVLVVPVSINGMPNDAVVFVHDVTAEYQPAWLLIRAFALLSLVIVLIAGGLAWFAAGRVMKPLKALRDLTTKISRDNLDERLPMDGTEDLAAVASSFNSMVDRMQAAFKSQNQLLDDAGHELRTPVTVVSGHLELMDVNDPEDVSATRDLAMAELDRMRRLTDDLVLLAKTERPDFLNMAPVDVADLTREAFAHSQRLGDREWVLGKTADIVVDGDTQRLLQAYLQFAANAVKFSEPGSKIEISSTLRGTGLKREVALSVTDNGVGISEENQTKVFGRFSRVDSTKQGAGLGLSIVQGIAKAHRGRIDLKSKLGVGSTFSVVIPAPDEPDDDVENS